jgi:hypothetical protein
VSGRGNHLIRASFAACVQKHGLKARLVPLGRRASHRRRVDEALAHGGGTGEVLFQGTSAVAGAGVPADRPLAVLDRRSPPAGVGAVR